MGRQSRLREERRRERAEVAPAAERGEPLRILRSIHKIIQGHCSESSRRCWEYLLEMLAQSSGWDTESNESQHLWKPMGKEGPRFVEFLEAWHDEVTRAKRDDAPFSEPIGQLLEEISGNNQALAQFLTPMPVVRAMNAMVMADSYTPPDRWGMPTRKGIDPSCGTGRMLIDALVHDDGIMMHGVDLDLWMLRAAMLNVRLLAPWTSCRLIEPTNALEPFTDKSTATLKKAGVLRESEDEARRLIVVGGRAIFMHGDALVVDLFHAPNWLCAGWHWSPRPWQSNLKIGEGFNFNGTWEQYQSRSEPTAVQPNDKVKFDFEMNHSNP